MAIAEMLIFPKQPMRPGTDPARLTALLRRLAFIGNEDPEHAESWLVGAGFNRCVMFLGCSPQLQALPVSDGSHLHIGVSALSDEPRFLSGNNTIEPDCPECGASIDSIAGAEEGTLFCAACGRDIPTELWRWRLTAAYARLHIRVAGIHPHEALPSDLLLEALAQHSGCQWAYAFRMVSPH